MEEAAGQRCRHHMVDTPRPGRLAENRDPVGISAECGDVSPHPVERGDLIEGAIVTRRAVLRFRAQQRVGKIAERPKAVVDRHQHDAAPCERRAVTGHVGTIAYRDPAAVDPHQHGRQAQHRSRR